MGAMAARMNVPMTPAEKAGIERRAAAAGLTAAEFIRRAADAYDVAEEAELRALLGALSGAVTRMEARLDAGLAALAALEADRSASRAAAEAEGRALHAAGAAAALGLG